MNLAHTIQQRVHGRLAVNAVNPNNFTRAIPHPDFKEEVL